MVTCLLCFVSGEGRVGEEEQDEEKKTMFALPFQPTTPNNNDLVQYSFLFQSSRKPRSG